MGKEKVIANEEEGRRGPEKDAHLKTPSLMWWLSPRFQRKKNSQKDHVVFVGPPPPPTWFDVVLYGTPPPPLTHHVVCVPSLTLLKGTSHSNQTSTQVWFGVLALGGEWDV